MLHAQVGHIALGPLLLRIDPVHDAVDGVAAHGVHGQLAVVLLAVGDGALHQFVGANGEAALVAVQVGLIHPGGAAGDAAVADELQTGGKNLLGAVKAGLRDLELRILGKILPHVVDADLLAETLLDGRHVCIIAVRGVQIAHVAGGGDALGGQELAQIHHQVHLLLLGGLGDQGGDQVAGGLPEDAGGLAVLIPVNLAALGVGGVLGDARHLQGLAVHTADVAAGADDGHGGVAAPLIQIVAGGGALFCQLALVIAPALDPLAGALLLPHVPDGLLELLDGVDLGRQAGNLFAEVRQHHRMLVGVHKPGEHPTALEIHRLIIGTGGQVGLGAHPGDAAILHRHRLRVEILPVRGEDLSVDIGSFPICVHRAQPPFCHIVHYSKFDAKKIEKGAGSQKQGPAPSHISQCNVSNAGLSREFRSLCPSLQIFLEIYMGNCSILTTKNMEKCLVKIFESEIKNFLLYQIFLILFQPQLLHSVLQFLGGHGELLGGGIETPGLLKGLPYDSSLILRQ